MDNVDLEACNDQPHDVTTGSQDDKTSAFVFTSISCSPFHTEFGLLPVSCTCQVFDVGPQMKALDGHTLYEVLYGVKADLLHLVCCLPFSD